MVVEWQALLHTMRHKAGVFAAAVVVALVVLQARRHRQPAVAERQRHVAAALQCAVGLANLLQHVVNLPDVHVFAVVAGAQQRDLGWREAEVLRASAL